MGHIRTTLLAMIVTLGTLMFPAAALAAEGNLTLTSIAGDGVTGSASSGFTVYIRDGDEAALNLSVKNVSGTNLEYVTMVDYPTYEQDGETIEPIKFSPPWTRNTPTTGLRTRSSTASNINRPNTRASCITAMTLQRVPRHPSRLR